MLQRFVWAVDVRLVTADFDLDWWLVVIIALTFCPVPRCSECVSRLTGMSADQHRRPLVPDFLLFEFLDATSSDAIVSHGNLA